MGVHVILDIDPRGIDPAQWEAAYDETAMLLSAWQPPLLGWAIRFVEDVRVAMYSNSVVGSDAEPPRWCVVGDRATLQTAECQEMHRSLSHYLDRCSEFESQPCSDILLDVARADSQDNRRHVTVFGDKTQGYAYHFAVLAAAMLVEERFPKHAMVSGDIDRGQAEEAARLAAPILRRLLPIPIRVDAPRLIERLREGFAPGELPSAFYGLYLGEFGAQEAVLRAFPGEPGILPWKAALSYFESPSVLGVVRLVIDWLNSGRELSEACRYACLDPAGPRYAPAAFMHALASTWIAVPMSARETLGVFRKPTGAPHTVASLFGSFFLDMQASGRHLRIQMDHGEIVHHLTEAFGANAPDLARQLFEQSAAIEVSLSEQSEDVVALVEQARTMGADEMDALATLERIDEIGPNQQLWLRVTAWNVTRAIAQLKLEPGTRKALAAPSLARRFIAKMIATHGPRITEQAWDFILVEERTDVLMWYMALVSLPAQELHLSQVRRALLENRRLLHQAMAIANDPSQMQEVEELVARARSAAKGSK